MLEKETDLQGVVNITPDHQHGSINISALRKGRAAISHKPVASVLHEVRRTVQARATVPRRRTCSPTATRPTGTLAAWIKAGVIGTVREVHNWTDRPFWPQGMQSFHESGPPVPSGFNWPLWQGPEPDRHAIRATRSPCTRLVSVGTGCLGDMGHYSLWQPSAHPRSRRAGLRRGPAEQRSRRRCAPRERRRARVAVAFPKASTVRWRHPATPTARPWTPSGATAG
jgi:hypothetical protein